MLCEYFKGLTLRQISQLSVERFKRERATLPTKDQTPRSPHTVNSELTTLSGILTLAVQHKLIRENPCAKVRRLTAEDAPERRLMPVEETALLESAAAGPSFLKPMIQLALWTGFRQGELIALEKTAIDLSRNVLRVVNPKWKRDRHKMEGVPMSNEARRLIEGLCQTAAGSYLLTGERGRKLKRPRSITTFRKACARAEIADLRFRDLRHEYGSRLGDVNLKKIARLMGHSNTRQTERYVHPTDEGLLAATEIAARKTTTRSTRIVPQRLSGTG